jgi:hypothetical protein
MEKFVLVVVCAFCIILLVNVVLSPELSIRSDWGRMSPKERFWSQLITIAICGFFAVLVIWMLFMGLRS